MADQPAVDQGPSTTEWSRTVLTAIALCSLGAGVIHASVAQAHGEVGVSHLLFFLVVAVAQIGWTIRVAVAPSRALLAAGIGGNLAVIGVWFVSRTTGLPFGPDAGMPEPVGFADMFAVLFEILIAAGSALLLPRQLVSQLQPARLAVPGSGRMAAGVAGVTLLALALPSHDHATHVHGDAAVAHGHETARGDHNPAGHQAGGAGQPHAHAGEGAMRATARGHEHAADQAFADAAKMFDQHEHLAHPTGGPGATTAPTDRHAHGDEHSDPGHEGDQPGHDPGHEPDPHEGQAFWWEPADEDEGAALMFRGSGAGVHEHGHRSEDCRPTADEQAAMDRVARETAAELKQYDNNPAQAMRDGFYALPIPTDRLFHMLHFGRIRDPDILKAPEIESFLYAVTDRGLTAIGGMYMMPEKGIHGPRFGGCKTVWHEHGGWQGRLLTAGRSDRTMEMLHVWTYPGLDPYDEYDGRRLSQLWTPGKRVPSICDEHNCYP